MLKFGTPVIFLYFCRQVKQIPLIVNHSMYQDNLDNDIYEDDYYDTPIEQSNWGPNLFARIVEFLQKSTSPDVIRLGIIADVRNPIQSEDSSTQWEKVETMRRYADSVNRGLGLPEDPHLRSLLQSTEWTGYGLFSMNFISRMNLDYAGICMDEQTNLTYESMIFLIALVKGMSMINIKHPSSSEENMNIYTYLIPSQFSTFSYASFLNVASNRLTDKAELTQEDIEDLSHLAFKSRYWKQGNSLKGKDSKLFIDVLKNILSDILGLTLNVDTDAFSKQARKEELVASMPKEITLSLNDKESENLSIAKAVEIVLSKYSTPQTRETLLRGVLGLRPDTKDSSFTTMLAKLHKQELINYYEGGLIGLKGKRFGRGYKKVDRLQKTGKMKTN